MALPAPRRAAASSWDTRGEKSQTPGAGFSRHQVAPVSQIRSTPNTPAGGLS